MLEQQGGVCKICARPASGGKTSQSRLRVDHDHTTGRNRGLLCSHCNTGIGQMRDDPALLRAAAEYLEEHRAC